MSKITINLLLITSIVNLISHSFLSADTSTQKVNKHVIGTGQGGFFSNFFLVLNHLWWCKNNKKVPVVYWDKDCLYHNKNGSSDNAWEYYFEPTSPLQYRINDHIHNQYAMDITYFSHVEMSKDARKYAHSFITSYIKVKPSIQNKLDYCYHKYIDSKKTIAIHIRGTDKHLEIPPVSADDVISTALKYADKDTQFFIASDEQKLLDRMKELLRGYKIVYYKCYRSIDDNPIHYTAPDPAQAGQDVLIEVLLMAQCNMLVHTVSNVSTAVLYFNPTMKHVVVSQSRRPKNP